MADTGRERLARLFRLQAQQCGDLGSLLYARLLMSAAADIDADGVIADVLVGHESDPARSALALRLVGAVHRIVLEGRAPELAATYPSAGGTPSADATWPAFRSVVAANYDEIRQRILLPPQTNEIGRAAVLIGGLLRITAAHGLPIRLIEIGASAGLNLRVDRFRYEISDTTSIGPADSPVVLRRPWLDRPGWPPTDVAVEVVERMGCDPDPIDPTSPSGRVGLASYVWPDQTARFDRLNAAFEVAEAVPVDVAKVGAVEFLTEQLATPVDGVVTVVWHSVVMQYLTELDRRRLDAVFAAAGHRATPESPVVRLSLEPRRGPTLAAPHLVIAATTWPGGREEILGTAAGHGPPVRWGTG
jgi:hypothetical protein